MSVLASSHAARGEDGARPFTLFNAGPGVVTAVEIAPAGQPHDGASLIGRVALPPGSALHITPPRGTPCLADLRIRWSDGRIEERARFDLCQPQRAIRVASPTP
ncbi:MAG: hypothetical protein ACK4PG_17110 [Acetobacteraceae bacterium]